MATGLRRSFSAISTEFSSRKDLLVPGLALALFAFFFLGLMVGLLGSIKQNNDQSAFTVTVNKPDSVEIRQGNWGEHIEIVSGTAGINTNNNLIYIKAPAKFSLLEDGELSAEQGIYYLETGSDLIIKLQGMQLIIPAAVKGMFFPANDIFYVLSGKVPLADNEAATKGSRITYDQDKFSQQSFDRNFFNENTNVKEMLQQMGSQNLLPAELQDLTPPVLKNLLPIQGQVTTERITLTGQTEAGAVVKINGKRVAVTAKGKFSKLITLKHGENKYTIVATDQAGNRRQESLVYTKTDSCINNTECGQCGNPVCNNESIGAGDSN